MKKKLLALLLAASLTIQGTSPVWAEIVSNQDFETEKLSETERALECKESGFENEEREKESILQGESFDHENSSEEMSGKYGDNITWELIGDEESGYTLELNGSGEMPDLEWIMPWDHLKEYIFSAVVSDGITTIGKAAFASCHNLQNIILPDSIKTIGELAFEECGSIQEIILPSGLKEIGSRAFANCRSLTKITIPESVTKIGENKDAGKDVFENWDDLTIYGTEESYAEIYAQEQNIPFVVMDMPSIGVDGITLSQQTVTLTVGNSKSLKAVISPSNASDRTVLWTSSNETVATVDANGKITAIGVGIAEITATAADGDFTDICQVTVREMNKSGKWMKNSIGWWYRYTDGTYPKNQWLKIDGKYYYFNSKGYMQKGWIKLGGKWYYLNGSGAMQTGWIKLGGKWYYLEKNGVMKTGWVKISGKWYYLNGSGVMQSGWIKLGGKWYYLNGSGAMQTGWIKLGGKWYYLEKNGVMKTGWVKISGKWYYLNGSGVMQSGWIKLGGKWYYLNGSGVMQTGWIKLGGKWYYLDNSGVMQTGRHLIDGKWYTFNSSGVMTGSTPAEITENTYKDVLAAYKEYAEKRAIGETDILRYVNAGAANFSSGVSKNEDFYIRYRLKDLAGDGEPELIIEFERTTYYDSNSYTDRVIMDIYGIKNGVPVRIIENDNSIGYRSRYYITLNNRIKNVGSGGALNSEIIYYKLPKNSTFMQKQDSYIYNGWEGNVYTHIDSENQIFPISKEKFAEVKSENDVDKGNDWKILYKKLKVNTSAVKLEHIKTIYS